MSSKDKWIRRFSVDETAKHKNGFTIYKITSVLFPLESPEAVTSISVWKRYSDVQRLHKSIRSLHAGLHLRGTFPSLPKYSYFKRFQQEVIDERAKTIKSLLEFIAEHRLLFTSTDFVNFLQTGYPKPDSKPTGVIDTIRSSLHLPIEETPPLEYQTDDEDTRSPNDTARIPETSTDETDFISQIPIYEAADVEIRPSQTKSNSFESLSSIESIDSDLYEELSKLSIEKSKPSIRRLLPDLINFDVPSTSRFEDYHTMRKTGNTETSLKFEDTKKTCNTDIEQSINSKFENHTMPKKTGTTDSETTSLNSNIESSSSLCDLERRSSSKLSLYSKRSVLSLSNVDSKTKTEDSYVFEAGYMLNLAARCEDMGDFQRAFECYKSGIEKMLIGVQSYMLNLAARCEDMGDFQRAFECYKSGIEKMLIGVQSYMLNLAARCEDMGDFQRAFECYKSGIEKMLIGVQTDTDPQRRALIKEKTNKYLSYAEEIYKNHLSDAERSLLPEQDDNIHALHCPIPISMLKRPYEDLGLYTVLAILGSSIMLVMHKNDKNCYAMKVMQKIPNNLTEFDEYFLQRTSETRTPILPTVIPYMVPLHAFIETNNLIFLILSYAPGEKLFNYIQNYAKSLPTSPIREVNLENVFTDPKMKDVENNLRVGNSDVGNNDVGNSNVGNNMNVDEIVLNSQKLLLNVDKVLTESVDVSENIEVTETPVAKVSPIPHREVLPPSAICKWGAEILTALESLHNSGVICRDLNPSNILLGERGQVILTYMSCYPDVDMLSKLRTCCSLYVAPELYMHLVEVDDERTCDYWSYGALMYQLICGVPLSFYHRSVFTSHTILELPDGISVEAESLLTQLLTYDPSERLGAGKDGIEEIKRHPYFKSIDWQHVYDSWIVPD